MRDKNAGQAFAVHMAMEAIAQLGTGLGMAMNSARLLDHLTAGNSPHVAALVKSLEASINAADQMLLEIEQGDRK